MIALSGIALLAGPSHLWLDRVESFFEFEKKILIFAYQKLIFEPFINLFQ